MNPSKVLVVIGHARENSLCHHLQRVACEALERRGAIVRVHDLLNDGFDPVLRLPGEARHALPEHGDEVTRRYQEDVCWMDAIVVVHPVWWFAPPAILKGWVDRVFVDRVAVEQKTRGPPGPLLTNRRVLVLQTFNAPRLADRLATRSVAGFFWKHAVFAPVGIARADRLAFYEVEGILEKALAGAERKIEWAIARLSTC